MKIVILYSGGLDSYLMLKLAEREYPDATVKCIYYAHGADSEADELNLLPDYVEVRKVDWLNESCRPLPKKSDPFAGAIYIPGRNLVFSVLAGCQELPDEIWLGVLADENNAQATDKNGIFRALTTETLEYVLSPFVDGIVVRFPFDEKGFTKLDAIRDALDNGVDPREIEKTVSCWHSVNGKHCGRCKQCVKRKLIFDLVGLKTEYVIEPYDVPEQIELLRKYIQTFNSGDANEDETMVAFLIQFNVNNGSDLARHKDYLMS